VPVQSRLRGLRQYDACFVGAPTPPIPPPPRRRRGLMGGGAIVNGAASQTHTILLFSPSLPLVASPTNSHEQTSAGAEAVSWLLKHRYAQTRVEAVMVGNDLMDAGHFHHVADKTDYVGACPI
jgi:hypothetical protein